MDVFQVETTLDAVGLVGVFLYLGGYAALQLGYVRGRSYLYAGINLAAALCVLAGLQENYNHASALIQLSFAAISLVGILRLLMHERQMRFTSEELALLDAGLPGVHRDIARQFLRAGIWIDAPAGQRLTIEGAPVRELVYLAEGAADVLIDDDLVSVCRGPTFIGELSCLDARPASATVELSSDARLYCVGATRLRALARGEPELAEALRAAFHADTGRKLSASNLASRELMAELRGRGSPRRA